MANYVGEDLFVQLGIALVDGAPIKIKESGTFLE